MSKAGVLDCTLRDGAYLVDKKFGDPTIEGIIKGLIDARIDYIEIGFLQNEGFGEGKTVYKNAADAGMHIPAHRGKSKFAVLADYSRYSFSNLEKRSENTIDIVRVCFFKHERYDALQACVTVKEMGYDVFIQPVDILGYSDSELIELIDMVNRVEPYCLSIVDTFGSMYEEDLIHTFSIIHHNLNSGCAIGFHSHNNLQLSNALSQSFLRLCSGKRDAIVDGTISGMGRGAGNTPTELIVQYMVQKLEHNYDIDVLLDLIDIYMDNIRSKCEWGYSTPYFLAGCYSAHVNNVTYLMNKSSIRSRDVRYILNAIGSSARKRYPYDLLDKTHLEYLKSDIDDKETLNQLSACFEGKKVLIIAPGRTAASQFDKIYDYIIKNHPVVITINFLHDKLKADFVYMGNIKRYNYLVNEKEFIDSKKIITSNIPVDKTYQKNAFVVSFTRLVKCGWEHFDNSAILLLRLLDLFSLDSLAIAGLDGYENKADGTLNYANQVLELHHVTDHPYALNDEIAEMLKDYQASRKHTYKTFFVTDSRFDGLVR